MTKQFAGVLFVLTVSLLATAAWSQEQDQTEEKIFNLIVGGKPAATAVEEEDEETRYEPRIEPGRFYVALTLGNFANSGTLLEMDNLIYKATDDAFSYGDVKIEASSSFNPIFRGGVNLTPWFSLEGQLGITFSEFTSGITDAFEVNPEGGSPEPVSEIGEFDPENRSTVVTITGINGLLYPFNLGGDGKGRWHPYVTGGVGLAIYDIDSDYTDAKASSMSGNLGVGLTLIADDLISVRTELLYHFHSIEFTPAEIFRERDAGTVRIPIYEFTDTGQYSEVEDFTSHSLGGLTWQLGFQLGF